VTTAAQIAALTKAVSQDRLQTYITAAATTGSDALDLYVWDRDISMALLADVAIVEVALRNSMHAALEAATSTPEWYLLPLGFDDRSQSALSTAWVRVPAKIRTPGRVVAQLMFGFWSGLLDSGGYRGREPQRFKCDYEQLWRTTLRMAFPGGRWMARAEGGRFSRLWVLETVSVVHATRNRAAHHEPFINGFPLPGQKTRLTPQQAHDACLKLARIIDQDLGSWLQATSAVPAVLARRP